MRLYLLLRVLRDTATVWRYRSSVEAAGTKRFVYFPPVGMRAATMWHVHQRPLTLIVWFQAGDPHPRCLLVLHWRIGALAHWCMGALVHTCIRALGHWGTGAWVHGCISAHRCFDAWGYPLGRHW